MTERGLDMWHKSQCCEVSLKRSLTWMSMATVK